MNAWVWMETARYSHWYYGHFVPFRSHCHWENNKEGLLATRCTKQRGCRWVLYWEHLLESSQSYCLGFSRLLSSFRSSHIRLLEGEHIYLILQCILYWHRVRRITLDFVSNVLQALFLCPFIIHFSVYCLGAWGCKCQGHIASTCISMLNPCFMGMPTA